MNSHPLLKAFLSGLVVPPLMASALLLCALISAAGAALVLCLWPFAPFVAWLAANRQQRRKDYGRTVVAPVDFKYGSDARDPAAFDCFGRS